MWGAFDGTTNQLSHTAICRLLPNANRTRWQYHLVSSVTKRNPEIIASQKRRVYNKESNLNINNVEERRQSVLATCQEQILYRLTRKRMRFWDTSNAMVQQLKAIPLLLDTMTEDWSKLSAA
jgi:hypothetical protein